jgi:hypothetical protein
MRLGEWRKTAPSKESMSSRVLAVLRPVLVDLGAEADAECWVAWGDDPDSRYSILASTVAGLITMAVRITGPDGPRATAKLVRWSKVSVTELGVEASGGHRIVAVQVESLVLKGVDDEADRICEFVRGLLAGIDGRNPTPIPLALLQGAAAMATVVPPATADEKAAGTAAPSKTTLKRGDDDSAAPAGPKPVGPKPVGPKPVGVSKPKAVPSAAKPVSKPAPKAADKPAALALVPAPVPKPSPEAAPSTTPVATPPPPTPIAARAAAAHHLDKAAATARPSSEPEPEPEPDRSGWVGPHPIEDSEREPVKPRPWKP